jgi:adenine-specific DNA-methyltransferase
MERDALKHILQSPYKRELWIKTVQFLSGQKNALTIFVEPKHISLHTKKQQEIVRELIQLGTLKTTDNVELPIFEIQLQENVKIEYNRVGVNELIKEYILKDAQKGAIATYYYKDNLPKEWRFSFISKHGASDYFEEAESVETTPKKYTYIFGTPEAHRTALERLFNLKQSSFNLEDFFEAFNVEPVSKNFFKEYKNFYLDFVHHLATSENRQIFETHNQDTEKVDLEIRNFVKRLLGRLVFLYFLQKKNWLGASDKNYEDGEHNFLENLFNGNYGRLDKELFYGEWLSKIFFNALNTPNRTNDGFELPNNKSVWIPFLNGGLFEENQEPENHKKLKIPAFMFGELFHFFNGYNFTIYENSPEDHIVAVDPEMLGNIFENLLEDNSDKGTFYTPKEYDTRKSD